MTIHTLPAIKRAQAGAIGLQGNTLFGPNSAFTPHPRTLGFPGSLWRTVVTMPPMREDEGGEEWRAKMAELAGGERFYLGDLRRIAPRGVATFQGPRSNYVGNNSMAGLVAGELGSGGVLPTGWEVGFNSGGWTVEVIGSGNDGAVRYGDFRFHSPTSAAPNGQINLNFNLRTAGDFPRETNDPIGMSAYLQIVGGSEAGLQGSGLGVSWLDSNSSFLSSTSQDQLPYPTTGPLANNRRTVSGSDATAGIAFALPLLTLNASVATTPDITIRIGLPMVEAQLAISPPLWTSSGPRHAPAGPYFEGWDSATLDLIVGGLIESTNRQVEIGDYVAWDDGRGHRMMHKALETKGSDLSGNLRLPIAPVIDHVPAFQEPIMMSPAQTIMRLIDGGQNIVTVGKDGFYRVAFEAIEAPVGSLGS